MRGKRDEDERVLDENERGKDEDKRKNGWGWEGWSWKEWEKDEDCRIERIRWRNNECNNENG